MSSADELICLFDDLQLINVYNLRTLQLKRTNFDMVYQQKQIKQINNVPSYNINCLTLDSNYSLYSTDGECIFNFDYKEFKEKKRIRPLIKTGQNLSEIISLMTILTNAKLVLLTDALQLENSQLFILKPVNRLL
jgi:hypothetical protein